MVRNKYVDTSNGIPFDQILVSQALHHNLVLVSIDEMIASYPARTFST